MNNQPNPNGYQPVYFLQRPQSPKVLPGHQSTKNLSLNMTIGANQTVNNILMFKGRPESIMQQAEFNVPNKDDLNQRLKTQLRSMSKENQHLKQQNEQLKKQIMRFKKQPSAQNAKGNQRYQSVSPQPYHNLRDTIKKQMGQIKQMRIKLDTLSKQCKMYQEIIDKMDERIKKLTHQNYKKSGQIDELKGQLKKFEQLKQKTSLVMRMYSDLQSKFNDHQLQWMKWKQNWLSQKEYYLSTINQMST